MTSKLDKARSKLKNRYIRGLLAKTQALIVAGETIGDPDAVATIRRLAHQMRGSGASYGLPEITDAATRVDEASVEELEHALVDLIALLERLSAESAAGGRVLVVDDDDDVVAMMMEFLAAPGRFLVRAECIAEAQKLLWAQPFDLVVLDLLLPDGDGRDLLAAMKRRPATAKIPVLALSGKYASHIKSECMALGVDQFFEKPVDFNFLSTTVSEVLERRQDALVESDRGSGHDRLTGLRDRASFQAMFDQVLNFCRRTGIAVSVALLEVDELEDLHRDHGPGARDDALVFVASTLVKCLREEDLSGRWDETRFVVALLGAREEEALFALGRIRQALARQSAPISALPGDSSSGPVYLSLSGGITEIELGSSFDDHRDDLESSVERAGQLLTRVRESGQNRIAYSASSDDMTQRRVLVAEDDLNAGEILRRLLDADDMDVTICRDGTAALEQAHGSKFDMVILDKELPGCDGFEVLTQLRARPAYRDIPIIMVTSTGDEEEIERAFALGADDYVVKPFRIRVLRARIRRHLRRGTSD